MISSTDTIFATICQRGRLLYSTAGTGFSSMTDLVNHLRGTVSGMVTLTVRNSSQGWSRTSSLYIA